MANQPPTGRAGVAPFYQGLDEGQAATLWAVLKGALPDYHVYIERVDATPTLWISHAHGGNTVVYRLRSIQHVVDFLVARLGR